MDFITLSRLRDKVFLLTVQDHMFVDERKTYPSRIKAAEESSTKRQTRCSICHEYGHTKLASLNELMLQTRWHPKSFAGMWYMRA